MQHMILDISPGIMLKPLVPNMRVRAFVRRNHVNHYNNLNLKSRNASASEIKSNFRKLSLKYHPDMLKSQNLSPEEIETKNQRYLQIKKSYEILIDPSKRASYDTSVPSESASPRPMHNFRPSHRRTPFTAHGYSSRSPNSDDVPHFDFNKHLKRNIRNEKRMHENRMMQSGHPTPYNVRYSNFRGGVYDPAQHRHYSTTMPAQGPVIGLVGLLVAFYALGSIIGSDDIAQIPRRKQSNGRYVPEASSRGQSEYSSQLVSSAITQSK
ncbi:hypothetical protein KL919_002235 [Ogataea angusta]|uniref:J domain-containing protein n=1 Tax=Pichia angusta TaxID=870730 RepID=A0AAN6I5L9_PICAN|nr:uncharacterized protein KL928_002086 [Ogataea angusta]KAG7819412.1 hypothetical protein KL928_002086 [Ogataea angusta]KAG7861501.1 hypothetical protein KL919_002235 [Ogataea angusta]